MPPRRSPVLTQFSAVLRRSMTEPLRNQGDHDGATAVYVVGTSTALASRLRCDGGSTAEARRNMIKVSAVPPRRSAVLSVFRGATAINDGTTAEPRRSWRCHCGLCHTSTEVAPGLRCDGGISNCVQMQYQMWTGLTASALIGDTLDFSIGCNRFQPIANRSVSTV